VSSAPSAIPENEVAVTLSLQRWQNVHDAHTRLRSGTECAMLLLELHHKGGDEKWEMKKWEMKKW